MEHHASTLLRVQIIEIATRTEHLLRECEHKDEFSPCQRCGDAAPTASMAAHRASPICKPSAGGSGQRCPLCGEDVSSGSGGGGKDGWVRHLLEEGCPRNPRTNGTGVPARP